MQMLQTELDAANSQLEAQMAEYDEVRGPAAPSMMHAAIRLTTEDDTATPSAAAWVPELHTQSTVVLLICTGH